MFFYGFIFSYSVYIYALHASNYIYSKIRQLHHTKKVRRLTDMQAKRTQFTTVNSLFLIHMPLLFFIFLIRCRMHPKLHYSDDNSCRQNDQQKRCRAVFDDSIQQVQDDDGRQTPFQLIHKSRILHNPAQGRRKDVPFDRAWLIRPECTWHIQSASFVSDSSNRTVSEYCRRI